jgi:uncharacterized protein YggE
MYQYLEEGQKRKLFGIVITVLILLAVYLGIQSLNSLKAGQYIGRGDYPANVISVNGTGETFATPNTASFSFSVVEEGKTAKDAQGKASKLINSVLAGIKSVGIEDKDIKTVSYNLYPKYDYTRPEACTAGYCPPGKQVLTGFELSQTVTVKVRDTEKAGEIVTKATESGAKNISGPDFVVDEIQKYQDQARDLAIKDAKEKADVLAKSLGVKLRRIVNFSENGGGNPVYFASGMAKAEAMSADVSAPVPQMPVGENKITSNITITYEVE